MSRSRTERRGFTLLELIVALVVTALVTAAAGVALNTARVAEASVQRAAGTTDPESRVRARLTDMLRHAPDAALADAPLIDVEGPSGARTLRFLSRGVREPFGSGPIWLVAVAVREGALVIEAAPVSAAAGEVPVVATLADVSAFDVQFFAGGAMTARDAWRTDWPVAQDRPALIELQWTRRAQPVPPLRVALAPLIMRP